MTVHAQRWKHLVGHSLAKDLEEFDARYRAVRAAGRKCVGMRDEVVAELPDLDPTQAESGNDVGEPPGVDVGREPAYQNVDYLLGNRSIGRQRHDTRCRLVDGSSFAGPAEVLRSR